MQSTVLEPRTAPAPLEVPLTEEERVRNGAAFLDEHVPGWRESVDPVALNIASAEHCVVGQVSGCFAKGAKSLGLSVGEFDIDRLRRFGFYWYLGESITALNAAWRRELGCPA